MCGVLAAVIGYYYFVAARAELQVFFRATVNARIVASLVYISMVVAGIAPWQFVLLAVIDSAMAAWTYAASHPKSQA